MSRKEDTCAVCKVKQSRITALIRSVKWWRKAFILAMIALVLLALGGNEKFIANILQLKELLPWQ